MSDELSRCSRCGEELAEGATTCLACGSPVPRRARSPSTAEPSPAANAAKGAAAVAPVGETVASGPEGDLVRRIARLQQWTETAQPLGIHLPSLPNWAEEMARSGEDPELWGEVVRGVERLSQKKVQAALEQWEEATKNRLARLEAYSVDGRLERDQIEDILHSARSGDLSLSLSTFQQVERVVTLKERHLDQAREELERLVSLLRDMQALGLPNPQDPAEISEDLERELRSGRLASLKQQLRALRSQAVGRLKVGLPTYVSQYGEFLVRERNDGVPVELEAAELARSAREFVRGRPEEALRRLRVLAQVHGGSTSRAGRARNAPPGGGGGATAVSRTT
ncbi:MAG: zinc-ribbon domain-containing protein [Thermoplasmata archaeon]|nr:zinc-ribbon domain-containing protein [Thermoplasmata archaeon]